MLILPPHLFSQNGYQYNALYKAHQDSSPLDVDKNRTNEYAQHCYDVTWALAFALNKTITGTIIDFVFLLLVHLPLN